MGVKGSRAVAGWGGGGGNLIGYLVYLSQGMSSTTTNRTTMEVLAVVGDTGIHLCLYNK